MTKFKVVTDSSCTMAPEVRDRLNIHVMPLSVMIDGVVYPDDDQLPGEKFMEMMAQSKELPKTSQPPIGQFVELFDELGKDGSEVLAIHMARSLSGTVDAARQAANLSKSKVTVLETDMTDQGLSFCVIRAAELAQEGLSLSEALPTVEKVLRNTRLLIGVATLENLVKGGRISRTKGLISSFLNIRVIMNFKGGELIPEMKGRGAKTFMKWFEGLKAELKDNHTIQKIGISYAGKKDQAERFKQELQEIFPTMDITVLHTTPIIATHTGEDAFAIMYYSE